MESQDPLWYFYKVLLHVNRFGCGGLPFECCDTLPPNCMEGLNVLHRYGTVIDLVTLDDPFKIFPRWVSDFCVEVSGRLYNLELSLGVDFLY
jgi:hypothetical protein